jgi:hypothetical protein
LGGEIQVLAGLAPFRQTVGSLLREPGWQIQLEKIAKSHSRIHFDGEKMVSELTQ